MQGKTTINASTQMANEITKNACREPAFKCQTNQQTVSANTAPDRARLPWHVRTSSNKRNGSAIRSLCFSDSVTPTLHPFSEPLGECCVPLGESRWLRLNFYFFYINESGNNSMFCFLSSLNVEPIRKNAKLQQWSLMKIKKVALKFIWKGKKM